jgi:hypothetical protein
MKKIMIMALMFVVLSGSLAYAVRYSMVGGIRSGLAVGVIAEQYLNNNATLRGGVEVTSGGNPLCAYLGGKFLLTYLGQSSPLSLGLGGVGFFGNSTDMGLSVTFIVDRLFDAKPLYLETGLDFTGYPRWMLQLGYKL